MSIREDEILAWDINLALDLMNDKGSKPRKAAVAAMGRNETFFHSISEHNKHVEKIVSALPKRRTKAALEKARARGTFFRRRGMAGAHGAERRHQGVLKHDT